LTVVSIDDFDIAVGETISTQAEIRFDNVFDGIHPALTLTPCGLSYNQVLVAELSFAQMPQGVADASAEFGANLCGPRIGILACSITGTTKGRL
jgi:hypothetical protein